jgi:hypothetical protein
VCEISEACHFPLRHCVNRVLLEWGKSHKVSYVWGMNAIELTVVHPIDSAAVHIWFPSDSADAERGPNVCNPLGKCLVTAQSLSQPNIHFRLLLLESFFSTLWFHIILWLFRKHLSQSSPASRLLSWNLPCIIHTSGLFLVQIWIGRTPKVCWFAPGLIVVYWNGQCAQL